jgi:hypothetical protein
LGPCRTTVGTQRHLKPSMLFLRSFRPGRRKHQYTIHLLNRSLVDHYVFVSEYVRSNFGESAHDAAISSIIYPGIDLSRFSRRHEDENASNSIGMAYRLEDDKLRPDSIALFNRGCQAASHPRRGNRRRILPSALSRADDSSRSAGKLLVHRLRSLRNATQAVDQFCIFVAPVWKESFG